MTDQVPEQLPGQLSGHMLVEALAQASAREVVCAADGSYSLTGSELANLISRYIAALKLCGVDTGTPLGLLSGNRVEVLALIGAGQVQGYRRTALHPMGSLDDHVFALTDAGIETLIVDETFAARADELSGRLPHLRILSLGESARGTDLATLADEQSATDLVPVDLGPDHVLSVTYTGGTTGKPKGVIGTTGNLSAMAQVMLAEWEWPTNPSFLMCTPLSHAGAAFFLPILVKGGRLVVLPRFEPQSVLKTISQHHIDSTMLVPSMIYTLLDQPNLAEFDLSSLDTVFYGAAAMNPQRLAEAITRIGPVFAQYYGQSECPMVITYLAKSDHTPANLASCGKPSPMLSTSLRSTDGQAVAVGVPGEIWVSGSVVAPGYWNRTDETAATFGADGWLRTGDVAVASTDGVWTIVDRLKDMIVTGGFNVFSREVEDALCLDPRVVAAGVVGLPDPQWGEAVSAFVVMAAGVELTPEVVSELQDMVRQSKGAVQSPKRITAVERLPLTGLGKLDKVALKAMASTS